MCTIQLTDSALDDLRYFKKNEQVMIIASIAKQLEYEAVSRTRNRKPLRANDLSQWEQDRSISGLL